MCMSNQMATIYDSVAVNLRQTTHMHLAKLCTHFYKGKHACLLHVRLTTLYTVHMPKHYTAQSFPFTKLSKHTCKEMDMIITYKHTQLKHYYMCIHTVAATIHKVQLV